MIEEIISFKEPSALEKLKAAFEQREKIESSEGVIIRFLPEKQPILKVKIISGYPENYPEIFGK
jgi:hypothetical protein